VQDHRLADRPPVVGEEGDRAVLVAHRLAGARLHEHERCAADLEVAPVGAGEREAGEVGHQLGVEPVDVQQPPVQGGRGGDEQAGGDRLAAAGAHRAGRRIPGAVWDELSSQQQVMILTYGIIQPVLLVAALVDLWRRPKAQVRGRKVWWAAASFVNVIGPIAYFAFGRRREP
jgi:hypothetical protein